MCGLLDVGRSSYYKWMNHEESEHELENIEIIELIKAYHLKYNGILGYRRMTMWINKYNGYCVNQKRIKRLMDVLNIKAVIRLKRSVYKYATPETVSENKLKRKFDSDAPNQKWVTDITEIKVIGTQTKCYLSAIIDLYDLSVVAYQISLKNDNTLVLNTFKEAFENNPKATPLVHSDRGVQYTSHAFKNLLTNQGCSQSMSRAGCCIDNGPIENFWGQLKTEKYYLNEYKTYDDLRNGIEEYISFYNIERLQKRFNNQTPIQVRELAMRESTPKKYPIPVNQSIKKFWDRISEKQQNKSESINSY